MHSYSHHRHSEDAISVNRMVAELSEENPSPVIVYKYQGSKHPEYPTFQDETLSTDVLPVSTQEFGFFMDSTHKTNEYSLSHCWWLMSFTKVA